MIVARTPAEVRAARPAGTTVGLVPTMGALHEGHISLIEAARRQTGHVVVSLFVNPTQFNEAGDLAAYPRDEDRDAGIAERHGADVLYAPAPETVYPAGFSTTVHVSGVTEPLEGAHRGTAHFDGVATVVLKLLNTAQPDKAFFGQKDAQQLAVIRRLVTDLDLPVEIVPCPTVREPDGLALSSRNVRLDTQARQRALALSRALQAAQRAAADGVDDPAAIRAAALAEMTAHGVNPEYLELVSPDTFSPAHGLPALVAVAARVGDVRLIDNLLLPRTP